MRNLRNFPVDARILKHLCLLGVRNGRLANMEHSPGLKGQRMETGHAGMGFEKPPDGPFDGTFSKPSAANSSAKPARLPRVMLIK